MTSLRRNDNFSLPMVEEQDLDLQIQLQAPRVDSQGVVQRDSVTNAVIYDPLNTTSWLATLRIVNRIGGDVIVSVDADMAGADGFIVVNSTGLLVLKIYSSAVGRVKAGMPYDLFAGQSGDIKKWLHGVVDYERATV